MCQVSSVVVGAADRLMTGAVHPYSPTRYRVGQDLPRPPYSGSFGALRWEGEVPSARGRLTPLGVVGEALPVDDHAGLITNDPGVMPWRTFHEIAGTELHLLTVVHDDLHAT